MRYLHEVVFPTVTFIKDLPNGGVLLSGCCGEFEYKGYSAKPFYCPNCKQELFFGRYGDW